MYKKVVLLFLVSIALIQTNQAQQRFKAGIAVGVNAAQINGDDSAGFNKLGLMGGLKAGAYLQEKTELGVEILFSQRGSQSTFFPNQGTAPNRIQLNYVEAPITFTFKDWYSEDADYYKMHFHAGFSYGRLINASADNGTVLVNEFKDNDFGVLAGVTYFASPKFGLTFRYNRSMTPLFNRETSSNPVNANTLWGFFLTFNGVYLF